jgi:hypothetical protein
MISGVFLMALAAAATLGWSMVIWASALFLIAERLL